MAKIVTVKIAKFLSKVSKKSVQVPVRFLSERLKQSPAWEMLGGMCLALSVLSSFLPNSAFAIQPLLSEIVITDVTDRSFSLIWSTDQPGEPTVEIYGDASATLPIVSGITVVPYVLSTGNPSLEGQARQSSKDSITQAVKSLGIAKVTVFGLTPGTDYFVKWGLLADNTLETTLCPDDGMGFCPSVALIPLKTELQPVRTTSTSELFLNDNLLVLNATAQTGEVVIVGMETGGYPVSAFIGDGVPAPYAIIDANNIYLADSNLSLKLSGSVQKIFGDVGEGLIIRQYKGTLGSTTDVQMVGISQGAGALITPVDRDYGDCNGDGRINGYDDLLLANAVAGTLVPADYASVAFHPLLCNLYKENGLDSVTTTNIVLDVQDETRLKALLIGKTPLVSLPEAP